ncbi:MAG: extracellular solute-binding protein [Epulopiscium sp.]|nr:extracellular solute-binding protein [Candidatus Epulonipiscium sp.]
MKKAIGLLLVMMLSLSMAACGGKNTKNTNANPDTGNKTSVTEKKEDPKAPVVEEDKPLFDKPVEITMMTDSHPSWPFQDDWYVVKAIKEHTNAVLKVDAIGGSSFSEKFNITMASGDLPDLMWLTKNQAQKYGAEGAFANVLDHLDNMPNFKKWYESDTDYALNFADAEGKLYGLPVIGMGETNTRGYLYREDIFKKHNLQVPTNEVEFYDVLKELKKEYPNSYPFAFRAGINQFLMMAPQWGTNAEPAYLPDPSKNEWAYGAVSDEFKEMTVYFNKLYKEGLIPTDFLTLSTGAWENIMTTSEGFIAVDYLVRIDSLNSPMREQNPDFTIAYMAPPKMGTNGQAMFPFSAVMDRMVVVSNNDNTENALKYADWMFSDEAKELLSWGEEGKTYTVENGERKWIDVVDMADIRRNYGLSTNLLYANFDYNAHMATFTPELFEATVESTKYNLPETPAIAFLDEEKDVQSLRATAIKDHRDEQFSRFIVGDRPLSEWDAYVKEIYDLGLEEHLAMYQKAYQRRLDSQK